MVTCEITGKNYSNLRKLSFSLKKMTPEVSQQEYYDKYLLKNNEKVCKFCKKNDSQFLSLIRGYKHNCNDKVCVSKSRQTHTLEYFKAFYSEEEALIKYTEKLNKSSVAIKNSYIKNLEINPNFSKEKSHNTINFWLKRGYSEEEAKLKSDNVMKDIHKKTKNIKDSDPEKYKKLATTSLTYWLNKGYTTEEAYFKLKERQTTFSLEKCILNFGKEEGQKIWQNRQDKWQKTLNDKTPDDIYKINKSKVSLKKNTSKISQIFCWDLYNSLDERFKNDTYFSELNNEYSYKYGNNYYRYDYTNIEYKKVIEFQGDFWHCNPSIYDNNYYHKVQKKYAYEILEKDLHKKQIAIINNCDILQIWESDYTKNPKQTIERCIQFITT